MQILIDSFKGSTIKHSSKSALFNIKIRLPKDKTRMTSLSEHFDAVEECQHKMAAADREYKSLIQALSNEAIPPSAQLMPAAIPAPTTVVAASPTTQQVSADEPESEAIVVMPKKKRVKKVIPTAAPVTTES